MNTSAAFPEQDTFVDNEGCAYIVEQSGAPGFAEHRGAPLHPIARSITRCVILPTAVQLKPTACAK